MPIKKCCCLTLKNKRCKGSIFDKNRCYFHWRQLINNICVNIEINDIYSGNDIWVKYLIIRNYIRIIENFYLINVKRIIKLKKFILDRAANKIIRYYKWKLNTKYKSAEIIKRFYLNVIKNRLYNTCSICTRDFYYNELSNHDIVKLECGHFYCYECISRWYLKNDRCPYCRKDIKSDYLTIENCLLMKEELQNFEFYRYIRLLFPIYIIHSIIKIFMKYKNLKKYNKLFTKFIKNTETKEYLDNLFQKEIGKVIIRHIKLKENGSLPNNNYLYNMLNNDYKFFISNSSMISISDKSISFEFKPKVYDDLEWKCVKIPKYFWMPLYSLDDIYISNIQVVNPETLFRQPLIP